MADVLSTYALPRARSAAKLALSSAMAAGACAADAQARSRPAAAMELKGRVAWGARASRCRARVAIRFDERVARAQRARLVEWPLAGGVHSDSDSLIIDH